jgi:hypothetical protein
MSTLVDAIRSNSHDDMTRLWSDSRTKLSDPMENLVGVDARHLLFEIS